MKYDSNESVPCGYCHAKAGHPCVTDQGGPNAHPTTHVHDTRFHSWQAAKAAFAEGHVSGLMEARDAVAALVEHPSLTRDVLKALS